MIITSQKCCRKVIDMKEKINGLIFDIVLIIARLSGAPLMWYMLPFGSTSMTVNRKAGIHFIIHIALVYLYLVPVILVSYLLPHTTYTQVIMLIVLCTTWYFIYLHGKNIHIQLRALHHQYQREIKGEI